jgi:peptidoglycan/LPS O-acetylase OafA/YrhL
MEPAFKAGFGVDGPPGAAPIRRFRSDRRTGRRYIVRAMSAPGDARSNTFDVLRLAAALAVLVSHAFILVGRGEPAVGDLAIGHLAVVVFVGISGFLITQSWLTEPVLWRYVAKRALRIYPALIVLLLITVLVLGPATSTLPTGDYLAAQQPWQYLGTNTVLWNDAFRLPGVFADNPFPDVVNGSLWTLKTELRAYVMIALLGVIGLLRRRELATVAILVIAAVAAAGPGRVQELTGEETLLHAFCVGALLYLWRDKVIWNVWLALAGLAAFAATSGSEAGRHLADLVIPYATIVAAYRLPLALGRLTARGDVSYGLYLYAFPVGQVLVLAWPSIGAWPLIGIGAVITYALAWASWVLVEAPALALKRRVVSRRLREPHLVGAPLAAAEH